MDDNDHLSQKLSDSEDRIKGRSSIRNKILNARSIQTLMAVLVISFQVFVAGIIIGILNNAHHIIVTWLLILLKDIDSCYVYT